MTRAFEAWALGLVLTVLALGLAIMPLLVPAFTRAQVIRYSEMPASEALPIAEEARRFVVTGNADARAALSRAMTDDAVTHLDDVRRVISGARLVTIGFAVLSVAWLGIRISGKRLDLARRALRLAAISTFALVVLVALVAVVDFDTFFSAFHGLFFEPGTWVFPSDSVLIMLFPEPFWTSAGIWWGALTSFVAAVYVALAGVLVVRAGSDE